MKSWNTNPIASSEITPEAAFLNRRQLIQAAGLAGAGLLLPTAAQSAALAAKRNPAYVALDKQTPFESASTYNNYYEFGTDKADPAKRASTLKTSPWTVKVEGEVLKPKTFDLGELLKLAPIEERVYRLRCVEGWSMVIPWSGYSLSELIKQVQPTGNAKFIEFISLADPKQMPGLSSRDRKAHV